MKGVPGIQDDVPHGDINSRFLLPGEFFFGEASCQIHTILGSCIAIALWHPTLHIGGMCHFILPERGTSNTVIRGSKFDGRYADEAMSLFEKEATRFGTNLSEYQAKIFGGSNMLSSLASDDDKLIGTKNIAAALKHLYERDIHLLVAHVGGAVHRRITFDVENGNVWVKH